MLRYISLLLISHVFSPCVNDPHYAFFAGVLIVHSCPLTRYQFGFIHHARFPSTYFNFVYISVTFSHFWVVGSISLSTPAVLFLINLEHPFRDPTGIGKLAPGIFFELYCCDFISPRLLIFPEFTSAFFSCGVFQAVAFNPKRRTPSYQHLIYYGWRNTQLHWRQFFSCYFVSLLSYLKASQTNPGAKGSGKAPLTPVIRSGDVFAFCKAGGNRVRSIDFP